MVFLHLWFCHFDRLRSWRTKYVQTYVFTTAWYTLGDPPCMDIYDVCAYHVISYFCVNQQNGNGSVMFDTSISQAKRTAMHKAKNRHDMQRAFATMQFRNRINVQRHIAQHTIKKLTNNYKSSWSILNRIQSGG